MSRNILDLARTRALALSTASAREQLDRATADTVIRRAMRSHGGVQGCTTALAQQYGEHPELTAPRVRWASQRIAALYPPASATCTRRTLHLRTAAAPQVMCDCCRRGQTPTGWPTAQRAAA